MTTPEYDYVIVGAGAAGCVLAARLSADPSLRVLLVEAGPDRRDDPRVATPARWPSLLGGDLDWRYLTEPQESLAGRRLSWPRGRLVGGSAAINAMVYIRGHAYDYDRWAEHGGDAWNWKAVEPLLHRAEQVIGQDRPDTAGPAGPPHPFSAAFVEAAVACGLPLNKDFNEGDQDGVGFYTVMRADGRRATPGEAYLGPALHRPNLHLLADAAVERITVEHGRATGVLVRVPSGRRTLRAAREVVLTAGTVGTAQLLLLSGIGPADDLHALGIPVLADRPQVGANLHDHVQVSQSFLCTVEHPVPDTSTLGEAGGFVRTRDRLPAPDVQLSFAPTGDLNTGQAPGAAFTLGPAVTRPESRGRLRLTSTDPDVPPAIDPRYLTESADRDSLTAGLELVRRIADRPELRALYQGRPQNPTAADAAEHIRRHAQTQFHPVGSCALGRSEDAVLTPELAVRQIEGLRVADASAIPFVPTGNVTAAVLAVAERAAELILTG
ncbi:GMC family oxidoreductase [Kitasatospora sp. NPDC004531]